MSVIEVLVPLALCAATPEQPAVGTDRFVSLSEAIEAPAWREAESSGGGLYVRASAGLVTTVDSDGPSEDIEFDEGFLLGAAIGTRLNSTADAVGFDLELEGLWTQQDAGDQGPIQAVEDVTIGALMVNAMLDWRVMEKLSIYGGAGVGAAWMDVGTNSDSINDFNDDTGPLFAWQARAGLAFHFSPSFAMNLGYRFINVGDEQIDDDIGNASFELETQQHVLEIGATFGF